MISVIFIFKCFVNRNHKISNLPSFPEQEVPATAEEVPGAVHLRAVEVSPVSAEGSRLCHRQRLPQAYSGPRQRPQSQHQENGGCVCQEEGNGHEREKHFKSCQETEIFSNGGWDKEEIQIWRQENDRFFQQIN